MITMKPGKQEKTIKKIIQNKQKSLMKTLGKVFDETANDWKKEYAGVKLLYSDSIFPILKRRI